MNTKLFRKVQQVIEEEPRRLNMSIFGEKTGGKNAPKCGTVGCIAGWAVLLSLPKAEYNALVKPGLSEAQRTKFHRLMEKAEKTAPRLLGISIEESRRLFFMSNWPDQFRNSYYGKTARKRAKLTSDRINHFLKTGK